MSEPSPADLARRATVAADQPLSWQDQLDWAEALLAGGEDAAAAPLLQAVAIQQGFSPELSAARAGLLAQAGIVAPVAAVPVPDLGGNTVELAIAELRAFARAVGPAIADSLSRRPPLRRAPPGLHPTAAQRPPARLPGTRPVAASIADLFAWAADPAAPGDAGAAIAALRGVENDPARFTAAPFAAAATGLATTAVALAGLRGFLRASGDLLAQPLGSPALFRAAGALRSAGLGPWFANVGQIARRTANLFELALIAEEAAATVGATVGEEAWLALLGRGLPEWRRNELIDELGDRNLMFALRVMLDRVLAQPALEVDRNLVMRVRDAALDNLDYALASHAQGALVRLDPHNRLERRILGLIDASAGQVMAAESSFVRLLREEPEDAELHMWVEANRLRRFAPFALTQGYGSPRDRQLKRLRLRAARAAA